MVWRLAAITLVVVGFAVAAGSGPGRGFSRLEVDELGEVSAALAEDVHEIQALLSSGEPPGHQATDGGSAAEALGAVPAPEGLPEDDDFEEDSEPVLKAPPRRRQRGIGSRLALAGDLKAVAAPAPSAHSGNSTKTSPPSAKNFGGRVSDTVGTIIWGSIIGVPVLCTCFISFVRYCWDRPAATTTEGEKDDLHEVWVMLPTKDGPVKNASPPRKSASSRGTSSGKGVGSGNTEQKQGQSQ